VNTPDSYTVVFHMKRPFSPALDSLMGYAVVIPAHLLARYPDLNHIPFNGAPIGTGPFKLVRWLRGDRVEYVANDRYHLGKPRLRKIVVRIVPQDATAALQVRTHEIDWYWRAQTTSFRDSRGIPGIRTLALEQNAHREMILNTTHPPLDDARVRQAIALAIDRKLLVQRIAFDTAQAACGEVPPLSWAYDPTVRCAYDPGEARRRLAALGFGPEGKHLHLELVFASGQEETQAVVIQIQAMLRAVGIDVELHAYDPSMLFALAANGGILSSGKFDLDVSGFINRPDPDDSRLLTCANRAPYGFNESRYCSPEMEAAQRESLESFDRAKRKRAISRIEHLVVRDAPEIYLWWARELHIVNSDISGIATPSGLATQLPYQWSI
ncbi:MAG: ABC transporter substrate-binding protein, partial [Vulcanimicrobiaceae bacterium]